VKFLALNIILTNLILFNCCHRDTANIIRVWLHIRLGYVQPGSNAHAERGNGDGPYEHGCDSRRERECVRSKIGAP
jgi:hypothetical protein